MTPRDDQEVIAQRIQQRTDLALRQAVAEFPDELTFTPLDELMISQEAWHHVTSSGFDPKLVYCT